VKPPGFLRLLGAFTCGGEADLPRVGYLVIGQGNRSEEDLRNGEAELGLAWLFCALDTASPEELRRKHEATCVGYSFRPGTDAFANLASTGELGAACPDFLRATAVVRLIGDIGAVWRALLALAVRVCARADRASPQQRSSLSNPVRPVFSASAAVSRSGTFFPVQCFTRKCR
jgi:hypothetical protein